MFHIFFSNWWKTCFSNKFSFIINWMIGITKLFDFSVSYFLIFSRSNLFLYNNAMHKRYFDGSKSWLEEFLLFNQNNSLFFYLNPWNQNWKKIFKISIEKTEWKFYKVKLKRFVFGNEKSKKEDVGRFELPPLHPLCNALPLG